jgi:hypothetical protein
MLLVVGHCPLGKEQSMWVHLLLVHALPQLALQQVCKWQHISCKVPVTLVVCMWLQQLRPRQPTLSCSSITPPVLPRWLPVCQYMGLGSLVHATHQLHQRMLPSRHASMLLAAIVCCFDRGSSAAMV